MRCPNCGKHVDYVLATQIVHISVKVDEDGEFIDNENEGDLYQSAYEFEEPEGDYRCPECDYYFPYIDSFKED